MPNYSDADELAAKLDTVIAKAPALIAAGVVELEVGGLRLHLGSPRPAGLDSSTPDPKRAPAKPHIDPLRDSSTYAGGRVPGFPRPTKEPE